MKIRTEVTIDLLQPTALPVVKAKQGDSNREVAVTLTAGGAVVIPDAAPKIYVKKPDGTKIYNACTLDDTKVIIPLRIQSVAVPGEAQAEIQIVDADGSLSTPIFRLIVYPTNIDNEAIESTDDFSALVEALKELEALKQDSTKAEKITYDDSGTALGTTNVQDAIEYLARSASRAIIISSK